MAETATARWRRSPLILLEAAILVVAVLYWGQKVFVPIALAVLLTFVLNPLVAAVQRQGLRRVYAVLLVVVFAFAVLFGIGWGVGLQIHGLAADLPRHKETIKHKLAALRGGSTGAYSELLKMLTELGEERAETERQEQTVVLRPARSSSLEQLSKVVEPFIEPLAVAGLVIILVIFMLISREDLRDRLVGLAGHNRLSGTTRVFEDTGQRLSRFLLTQLLVNAGFGLVIGIGFFVLARVFAPDQPSYALLWGLLAALLRFVPYVGTWVAAAFPLLFSFAVTPGWTFPVLVLALFLGVDLFTANVIEPLLFSHSIGVTPVALLIAAAFWTWIWGPVGLVLSNPMTVCLVVLGQHVPQLRFLSVLLGDQPPLPPSVRYYQRLLARDREEATLLVRDHVRRHTLQKTCDEVLVPALLLTRRDRKAESVSADEEAFVIESTAEILREVARDLEPATPGPSGQPAARDPVAATGPIDTSSDGGPGGPVPAPANPPRVAIPPAPLPGVVGAPGSPEAAAVPAPPPLFVLGCPAHHEAEELTLEMLALLLRPGGCRLEALSTRDLPSEVVQRIEDDRPAAVFIAVLPPGGLVQAAYLSKRLRKGFPKLPIIVGCWGERRRFDKILVRLRSAGASYVTTSLAQSRTQVLSLLHRPASARAEVSRARETQAHEPSARSPV